MNVQVVGRESMVLGFVVVFGFRMRASGFRRFRARGFLFRLQRVLLHTTGHAGCDANWSRTILARHSRC